MNEILDSLAGDVPCSAHITEAVNATSVSYYNNSSNFS